MAKELLNTSSDDRPQASIMRPVAVAAIVAGIAGGLSGYGMSRWLEPKLDLRARPRIAVVSYADALTDASAEQVTTLMAEIDAKAKRLSDAGFVVLNDNAIVAAPSGLRVPVVRRDD